jgi:hypothetical protein
MTKWIDVNDSVPVNNERVIIYIQYPSGRKCVSYGQYTIDGVVTHAVLDKSGEPVWYDYISQQYTRNMVCHWMPLPDVPHV